MSVINIKKIIKIWIKKILNLLFPVIESEWEAYKLQKSKMLLKKIQSCGYGVRLNGSAVITDPNCVILGNNVHIGNNAYFLTSGGLSIGDNTHISRNVTICTQNYNCEGSALPFDDTLIRKPVSIGKNVWIGMNVNIIPGIRIGDGAVIGMGTTLTRNVENYEIIENTAQSKINSRDLKNYSELDKERKIGGTNGKKLTQCKIEKFKINGSELEGQLFFITGTGRSGTTTIANLMDKHPEINCFHEPRKQLVRLSTEYAHNEKNRDDVVKELCDIYHKSTFQNNIIYGESDHKIWNLLSIIDEVIKDGKFILILRDGRDFVSSALARGWFDENKFKKNFNPIYSEYRINGWKCKAVSYNVWKSLTQFEKICWFWSYVNTKIEEQILEFPEYRRLIIRLENLGDDLNKIYEFLNVKPIKFRTVKLNVGKYPKKKWEQWNEFERYSFERWCSKGMDKWYPNWKNLGW